MPESLTHPEPRSPFLTIFAAIAAIAVAIAIAIHFFPATTVNITHIQTRTLPQTAVFKSDTILNGIVETSHTILIATTVRIDNQLQIPLYLEDYTLTLTNPTGAELTTRAYTKSNLPNLEVTYPALRPLLATPLNRDTSIDPGKSAQGTILFALDIPQSIWDQRKSAVLKVDLYHRSSIYLTIPKP